MGEPLSLSVQTSHRSARRQFYRGVDKQRIHKNFAEITRRKANHAVTDFRRNADGTYLASISAPVFAQLIRHRQQESPTMPMRGELSPIPARSSKRVSSARIVWSHFRAAMCDQDLQCVACLCVIGLLIAINLILRLPDVGTNLDGLVMAP
jgi:hypothetical protein